MAGAEEINRAAGGGTALGLGKRPQALDVIVAECLDAPFHPPAAALRELGTQRDDAAAARAAPLTQRLARLGQRPPLQRAATDRAKKSARRPHHHDRPRLARARPLGLDEADERGGTLGFDRFDEAAVRLHGRDVSTEPANANGAKRRSARRRPAMTGNAALSCPRKRVSSGTERGGSRLAGTASSRNSASAVVC